LSGCVPVTVAAATNAAAGKLCQLVLPLLLLLPLCFLWLL
jgi:hypothetical protein